MMRDMAPSEHALVRIGVLGKLLLVVAALAASLFAAFWISFRVSLDCERSELRDLVCALHTHDILGDTEETIVAGDVTEVTVEEHEYQYSGSRKRIFARPRRSTMLSVVAVTESERVRLPLSDSFAVSNDAKRAIAAELDAFVKAPDGRHYSRVVAVGPVILLAMAVVLLLFPPALWLAARKTIVAVDRRSGTVIINRCRLGVSMSKVVVPLARTVTVIGKAKHQGQDLFLELTRGEPLFIDWVPRRRAVADFAALKRLFPIDRGVSG